jgi:hypothetical protein
VAEVGQDGVAVFDSQELPRHELADVTGAEAIVIGIQWDAAIVDMLEKDQATGVDGIGTVLPTEQSQLSLHCNASGIMLRRILHKGQRLLWSQGQS